MIVFMSFLSQNCFLIVSVVALGILFRRVKPRIFVLSMVKLVNSFTAFEKSDKNLLVTQCVC